MLKVRMMVDDYGTSLNFVLVDEISEEKILVAKPLEFEEFPEGGFIAKPTFSIKRLRGSESRQEMANLILSFISCAEEIGVTLKTDGNKEKEAILRHLEDMRSLVFKFKNGDKK